ncbi:MAG TPA: hypothetical protein VN522_14410 [Solirubrobacterales bacterium]|nr:hypothetical protein [Solirubrobacterales bacterium]
MFAVAALLPAVAGAGGTTHHQFEFRLSGPEHQDMVGERAILIRARCIGEPCTVVASAKSESPALHSGTARARIGAGETEVLTLPLAPRQRGKLKAALEAGRSPTFTVAATAHDAAGTYVPLSLEVRAQKP